MSTTGNWGTGGTDRLIAGRYRLLSRLGRGGMGTVWRAEDELLGRQVAVKEVHLRGERSAEEREQQHGRTLREARAVAQVRHPSVVGVHDVVDQDGEPWIVMELVDGVSLGTRLSTEGPLQPRETATLGLAVLSALQAAHARGVLHRDVKPDNVLLERETGRVVLTDFGIARLDGSATLTEDGAFLGSPEFTAPERTEGRPAGPASDLWSVGVLLCTALEGRSPFRRDSMSGVLYAVLYEDIVLPASVEPLAEVVRGLLQRDPAQRSSAKQAAALLTEFLARGTNSASRTAETFMAAPGAARPVPVRQERTLMEPDQPPVWPSAPTVTVTHGAPGTPGTPATATAPTASPSSAAPAPTPATPTAPAAAAAAPPPSPGAPGASLQSAADPGAASTPAHRGDSNSDTRRRSRRRSLLLGSAITVVAAAAIAAAALFLPLGTNNGSPSAVGTQPPTTASPSVSPSRTASATPSVSPSRAAVSVPAGYTMKHDSGGFSLAVPVGWIRSTDAAGRVFYLSPDSAFRIGIHPTTVPPGGALAELRSQDAVGPHTNPGYRDGSVQPTVFHGSTDAALWQWTWNGYTGVTGDGLGARRVQDLCWTEGGRSYDFWVSAPTGRQNQADHYFQIVSATFQAG